MCLLEGIGRFFRSDGKVYVYLPHIANVGIRSHMGNHRVERLHDTMREREKVMRHLKKADSADKVFKGFRSYYNFVRPHMALDGHTPAQAAAVPIELGTNKWLDLLQQAARQEHDLNNARRSS